ncbi:MAG: efflux RND transporter periplasmic adaptor subunit [Bacteroidales bacterium]|nr:efflux RND transporter periplasmic adaptor subunit [Bacteroidales bacterium]
MNKITFLLALLFIFSCNSGEKMPVAEEILEQLETKADTISEQVDIQTSATSKPNQISFNGTMIVPPSDFVTVSLTIGGIIKNTYLLPGNYVSKNTVLATIENPDFIQLQQTYLDSYAQEEYLETEYERQKALSLEQAASQKKFQQSKADYFSMKSRKDAAAAQLILLGVQPEQLLTEGIQSTLQVKAPISGYVGDILINTGKYVNVGEPLCEIIDKKSTLLRLVAYEKDLDGLRLGAEIEFKVNGMNDQIFAATVISIGQKIDEVSRSLDVYARVKDKNIQFRPGMYVTARLKK